MWKEMLVFSVFMILALVHSSQEKYMGPGDEYSISPATKMPAHQASLEASGVTEVNKRAKETEGPSSEPRKEPTVEASLESTQKLYLNFLETMIEVPTTESIERSTTDYES